MDTTQEQEAPQKLGFFGKVKLAVTSFVKSAIKAVPASIAYSAVAFTASAILGQQFGVDYDFLKTGGSTIGQLGMRMLGASVIGGTISGAVGSYQAVSGASKAEELQALQARSEAPHGRGQQPQTQYDVSPPMTPVSASIQQRVRI